MLRTIITALSMALTLSACGGGGGSGSDGGNEAPTLSSITITPSGTSLGIGQKRIFTAEARDQKGAAMSGVTFTWTSSDSNVATVADGVAIGVASGITEITASSGGVTSNAVTLSLITILIDKRSIFFPASGLSSQLAAQIVVPAGAASPGAVTWTSTAPDKVSVDATGRLVANAIGSAQIFAEADGIRSMPTLVVVAVPQPGALLVTDAQIVSVGPPLNLLPDASPGVGTQYEVTLQGVTAPTPGTVVLAAESAPVAGKVISTRTEATGLIVTLVIAPLYELVSDYNIDWNIDLAAFTLQALPDQTAPTAQRMVWTSPPPSGPDTLAKARPLGVLDRFEAFKCDGSIKPELVEEKITLAPEIDLKVIIIDRPGYSKHLLTGSATLNGSASLTLQAGFKAKGKCELAGQFKIPVGWLSFVIMPAVRFGLGIALDGELQVVQGELAVGGKIGADPIAVGWECGGATAACRSFDQFEPVNAFETKSKMPSLNDMKVKISGQFYILAGLDISLLLGAGNAKILEARVGPKQFFDLAFEDDQAAKTDYASFYDLKLEGVIEPGSALKKAIEMVIDDDAVEVTFKAGFSQDLSESPKGTLSVNKSRVPVRGEMDFNVVLDQKTIEYFLLGDNAVGVTLFRKRQDEIEFIEWKAMSKIGSNAWTYHFTASEADLGKYDYAAFVNTQLLTPLLEIAPNSIQPVEVSCFTAGPVSLRAKPTAGAKQIAPLALTCEAAWVGTIKQVVSSVANPGGTTTITTVANVTFEFDKVAAADAQPGEVPFKLRNGTFTYDMLFESSGRNPPCRSIATGGGALPLDPYQPLVPAGTSANLSVFPATSQYGGTGLSVVTITSTSNCNDSNVDITTVDPIRTVFWWTDSAGGETSADGLSIRRAFTAPNGVLYDISLDQIGITK